MSNQILYGKSGNQYVFDPTQAPIGKGGMGVVFKGYNPHSHELVAIKVMYRDLTQNASIIERAILESSVQIAHPNLIRMLDFVEQNGIYHIISEYLEGQTVRQRLLALKADKQTMDFEEARRLLNDVLDGLAELHQHNIIHRDIDPSNMMILENGSVKLMDFGIAKFRDATDQKNLTRIGALIGKAQYAPPEQIQAQHKLIKPSSDLYALGMNLYELLTGAPPFDSDSEYGIMQMQVHQNIEPHPNIPDAAYRFILKATDKEQNKRFQDAISFKNALNLIEINPPIIAPEPAPQTINCNNKTVRPIVSKELIALAAIVLFTICTTVWYFMSDESFSTPEKIAQNNGEISATVYPPKINNGNNYQDSKEKSIQGQDKQKNKSIPKKEQNSQPRKAVTSPPKSQVETTEQEQNKQANPKSPIVATSISNAFSTNAPNEIIEQPPSMSMSQLKNTLQQKLGAISPKYRSHEQLEQLLPFFANATASTIYVDDNIYSINSYWKKLSLLGPYDINIVDLKTDSHEKIIYLQIEETRLAK